MTKYEVIYDLFLKDIKNDNDFFYVDADSLEEEQQLILEKCDKLFKEANVELMLNCTPDVDFMDRDEVNQCYNFELTETEMMIIKDLMFEKYLGEDVSKLKSVMNYFTPKELERFSPAKERESYMEMVEYIAYKNRRKIKLYESSHRENGKRKTLSYENIQ